MSNTGAPVDILAPGYNILAKSEVLDEYVLMTGTSPAAALVAGSALAELSMNGSLTPAEVEARLIASATPSNTTGSPPVLRTTPIAAATIAFPDGVLTSSPITLSCAIFPSTGPEPDPANILNVFHGVESNASCSIAVSPQDEMEFTFPIDLNLLNPSDLFTLRNGYSWRIRRSDDLDSWDVPQGTISKASAPDGTVWLTAKIPVSGPSGFLRVEVADTP